LQQHQQLYQIGTSISSHPTPSSLLVHTIALPVSSYPITPKPPPLCPFPDKKIITYTQTAINTPKFYSLVYNGDILHPPSENISSNNPFGVLDDESTPDDPFGKHADVTISNVPLSQKYKYPKPYPHSAPLTVSQEIGDLYSGRLTNQ
jgi:hypothetical protein